MSKKTDAILKRLAKRSFKVGLSYGRFQHPERLWCASRGTNDYSCAGYGHTPLKALQALERELKE